MKKTPASSGFSLNIAILPSCDEMWYYILFPNFNGRHVIQLTREIQIEPEVEKNYWKLAAYYSTASQIKAYKSPEAYNSSCLVGSATSDPK